MGRIAGFVLLAAVVVVGLFLFLRKKKREKTSCEKVLQIGEKAVDSYYKTNTSSIVDDSKDSQLCKLADAVGAVAAKGAGGIASGAASFLSDHTTLKGAVTSIGNPIGGASQIAHGDVGGGIGTIAGSLSGADVINTLNYGKPLSQQSCAELKKFCPQGWKIGLLIDRSNSYCSTMRSKGCA